MEKDTCKPVLGRKAAILQVQNETQMDIRTETSYSGILYYPFGGCRNFA